MAKIKNKNTGVIMQIADSPEEMEKLIRRRIERNPDDYELIEDDESEE